MAPLFTIPPERQSERILQRNRQASRKTQGNDDQGREVSRYAESQVVAADQEKTNVESDEETELEDYLEDDEPQNIPDFEPFQPEYTRTWSVPDLLELYNSGMLDLEPPYQRGVVWKERDMSAFIHSVMENASSQKIMFNRVPLNSGTKLHKYICVDGKQRLTSIICFAEGQIPWIDKQGQHWFYKESKNNPAGQILSEEFKHLFRSKSLTSCEYTKLSFLQESDLFARAQMGRTATAAEKAFASSGAFQDLARSLEKKSNGIKALSQTIRGAVFANLLTAICQIVEMLRPSPRTKDGKPNMFLHLNKAGAFCRSRQHECSEAMIKELHEVFKIFEEVAEDLKKGTKIKLFTRLEFAAAACLIAKFKATRSQELLAKDILAMRNHLEKELGDSRLHKDHWAVAVSWTQELELHCGVGDKSTCSVRSVPNRKSRRLPILTTTESEESPWATTNHASPRVSSPRNLISIPATSENIVPSKQNSSGLQHTSCRVNNDSVARLWSPVTNSSPPARQWSVSVDSVTGESEERSPGWPN